MNTILLNRKTIKEATHSGQFNIIPGISCDVYIADNGEALMSERGFAKMLGINQMALNRMATNGLPKTLKPFIDEGWAFQTNPVKVTAANSPYKGRYITVYTSDTIEAIIRAYALALINEALRANQRHIGVRCITLICAFILTSLETAIKEACGLPVDVVKTAQQNYLYAVTLLKAQGFGFSVANDIATKKDLTKHFGITTRKLDDFLKKSRDEITPIKLDRATIRAIGSTAPTMNGYSAENVGKIALYMPSKIQKQLQIDVLGEGNVLTELGSLAKPETKGQIEWLKPLKIMFKTFDVKHNSQLDIFRPDFLIEELKLCIELNGFDNHASYDPAAERAREKVLLEEGYGIMRFNHQVDWEDFANGILHSEVGTVVKRYDIGKAYRDTPLAATHYGQAEFAFGVLCDVYVLSDGSTVFSERGAADLFGIRHRALQSVATNGLPKNLESFVDKGWSMKTNSVKVVADNSPHKGREITVYDSKSIETIIRGYALAFASNALRANQKHIGKRCSILACALVKSAVSNVIQQVCHFTPKVQKTIQRNYQDVTQSIVDLGLKCSAGDKIAIKTDITEFLDLPLPTLNYHLGKHRDVIKPIQLDISTIESLGSTARRMNGYHLEDVGKIVLAMDSVIGIELKEQIFGTHSSLALLKPAGKIKWPQSLPRVFAGFNLQQNCVIAGHAVDFFVDKFLLVLEFENKQSVARKQFLLSQDYRVVHFKPEMEWEIFLQRLWHSLFKTNNDKVIPVSSSNSQSAWLL